MGWKELEVDRIKILYTCVKLKIRRENPSKLELWLSGLRALTAVRGHESAS